MSASVLDQGGSLLAPDSRPRDDLPAPRSPLYGAPGAAAFRLDDALITLWMNRRLLVLAFLLPVALGLVAAMLAPRRFVAESVLLVQATRESSGTPDVTGFGPSVISVEILKAARAEMEILRSPEVLRAALVAAGPAEIFPNIPDAAGSGLQLAVEALRRALGVDPDPTSNVLRVFVTLPDRERALRALQAIMEAYFHRRVEIFADGSAQLLTSEVELYNTRIRAIEEQIRQVQARHSVLDITQEIQLAARRRDDILQRESRVREQQATAQAQLALTEGTLSTLPGRVVASVEATNLLPTDESRNALSRLLQERERVAAQYTSDYPGLRDLDQRIASIRAVLRENARTTYSTTREVRNPGVELLNQRLLTLTVELGSLDRQLEELARQRGEAERLGTSLLTAERDLRELVRQRDGLEAIVRQLTTREAGSRIGEEARRSGTAGVQLLQAPSVPLQGRSGRLLLLAAGVMGGFVLAGSLGLLLCVTRRSCVTPGEAERALSLPVLATFGTLPQAQDKLETSPEIEDFIALLRDAQRQGRRPRLVNLVATGATDGRAELARALAVALAKRSKGEIALLDLQTDGRAHLAALGAQPMAVERIPGHLGMFNTVLVNLWISFEASKSDLTNPRASREQTAELLNQLRAAFDTVVIIGPDDTHDYAIRRMAGMVDANVIVVHGERTRGNQARLVRDWVLGAGGSLLGFTFLGERQILPPRLARLV